jgi:hypothetical protein
VLNKVWTNPARVVDRHVQDRIHDVDGARNRTGGRCAAEVDAHQEVDIRLHAH